MILSNLYMLSMDGNWYQIPLPINVNSRKKFCGLFLISKTNIKKEDHVRMSANEIANSTGGV